MGDVRYERHFARVASSPDPASAMRAMADDEVVQALAGAVAANEPLLVNVLATEAMNRIHRAGAVASTIAEAALAVGLDGRISWTNAAAARLLGWERGEAIGRPAREVARLAEGETRAWPAPEALAGRVVEGEARMLRRGGSPFHALYAWAPIVREGDVVGLVLTLRDITERVRLAEDLALQKTLLEAHNEASGFGILILDEEGGFVSYNRRFLKIWGLDSAIDYRGHDEAALEQALRKVEDPDAFFEPVRRLQRGEEPEGIWDAVRLKDGRVLERFGAAVRLPDGTYRGSVWNFRDASSSG